MSKQRRLVTGTAAVILGLGAPVSPVSVSLQYSNAQTITSQDSNSNEDAAPTSDTGNQVRLQRQLSYSYDRIGDTQATVGNLSGALASYEAALAIRQRLARAFASNSCDPFPAPAVPSPTSQP